MIKEAKLALEDGTIFKGKPFGFKTIKTGEVVFSTGMTGYVESLTDPSFKGQILLSTYPLEGNYGISSEWFQSDGIKAEGYVVRDQNLYPSHRLSEKNLSDFLEEYKIPGISGVDTRSLTLKIRRHGTLKGALSTKEIDDKDLLDLACGQPGIEEMDLVDKVCVDKPLIFGEDYSNKVIILDCGVKNNIVNAILKREVGVIIVPHNFSSENIMDYEADGILVSSGPGSPIRLKDAINTIKKLKERLPIFGICMGLQVIALAFGAKIYKMKFGHRGANQPVKDLTTGKVFITSQNHGFALEERSLSELPLDITQFNLNDGTPEGIKHHELPIECVQYHPEAGPGPHDTDYFFDHFVKTIQNY